MILYHDSRINICLKTGMSFKNIIKSTGSKIKTWLAKLSFRTGVIVLLLCIPLYVISFTQMALPISSALKSVLWVMFFGLAKTAQYGGLTILGTEGIKRLRKYFKKDKTKDE